MVKSRVICRYYKPTKFCHQSQTAKVLGLDIPPGMLAMANGYPIEVVLLRCRRPLLAHCGPQPAQRHVRSLAEAERAAR
jgi:hypothetical protein